MFKDKCIIMTLRSHVTSVIINYLHPGKSNKVKVCKLNNT